MAHASRPASQSPPRFRALVDEWLAAGAVREWRGPVGTLRAGDGSFEPLPAGGPPRYVAVGGMARLAEHLASPVGGTLWSIQQWSIHNYV